MSDIITAKDAVNMATELTSQETFQPTPAMKVWLDTAIELHSDSPTEIATASQLTKQAWYKWLAVPGFEDWYYENYKRGRRRWLPTLDKIGMQNAKRDYNFWKDMRKAAGESGEEAGAKVQINNIIGVKRDEYGL